MSSLNDDIARGCLEIGEPIEAKWGSGLWSVQPDQQEQDPVKSEIVVLQDLLIDTINQACRTENGILDSMRLSAYENALKHLEKEGKAEEIRVGRYYRWKY